VIGLRVDTASGHYRVPGQMVQGCTAPTFDIAPVSTMKGFLESLCAAEWHSFDGEVAYGWIRPPGGRGLLYRRAQIWASPITYRVHKCPVCGHVRALKVKQIKRGESHEVPVCSTCSVPMEYQETVEPRKNEGNRTYHVDTFIDLSYAVLVRGPWEAKVREALAGNVNRYGTLYLGESSDQVVWIGPLDEVAYDYIKWVVPGNDFPLPVISGRGFGKHTAVYESFTLRAGKPAWL